MKNVKEILNVTKEGFTIKSTDLVDIINKFRKEEGRKVELQHKSFMAKIRKELEILEKLGLKGEQNILPTYYLDKQGKERECFELNRDGMLQMLNSESTYCRYKTIEYINKLEDIINKTTKNYSLRMDNLTRLFLRVYPQEYESIAKEIIEYHINLPKKLRLDKRHRKMDKTEYKQFVRDKLVQALEEIQKDINNKDIVSIRLYAKDLIIKLKNGLLETNNRSKGQLLGNKEREIEEFENELQYLDPPIEDYTCVHIHPFSYNYMTEIGEDWTTGEPKIVNREAYKKWQRDFPRHELDKEGLELDYNKKTYLWLKYDCLPKFDAGDNFIKAFKDELARAYNVDDKNIMLMRSDVNEFVNSYSDGKIYYIIRQAREDC
ncbi:hypothetical protein BS638_06425 [Clostridium tepidum]|uniref:Uncharacterized protein n=1 Tax=Clostridium tepidum TaxID=1962263 RepID=A0A1S9I944_9CLOT|nr:hypothetical protein [Clostridium tepidum]OOO66758.1 hypothetical protein BS638_06425 [Clostridium tepidum]